MSGDRLPFLSAQELHRLVDIGADRDAVEGKCQHWTASLGKKGCVEWFRDPKTGTLSRVRSTALGVRVLAGLPGPEFDRFREMVESTDA